MAKLTIPEIKSKKEKITMLTAYDYPIAQIVEKAGIDILLVGDSLGTTVLGYESTIPVTMNEMIHHSKAVRRGAPDTFLIGDMPFLSYQISTEDAVRNAGRFIKEAGCDAVKVEGAHKEQIKAILKAGIPVLGHAGLTPQTATILGGLKVQGRDLSSAETIYKDSILLEEIGCFAIILECVPHQLTKIIAQKLTIPVIGIGAGSSCDGQVLVTPDILGLVSCFKPKFIKQYLNLNSQIEDALNKFKDDVHKDKFPAEEHSFKMKEDTLQSLKEKLKENNNGQ
ncbi:MAG: 3-methyl-2-oxobutanoate hydroxymethyltransferase [Candidatus Saelkia tenebricola]|nr:3-methyl-2-oxobutanoate hydroxymethyltransferase [Candidatus Saelkia tenebricola]